MTSSYLVKIPVVFDKTGITHPTVAEVDAAYKAYVRKHAMCLASRSNPITVEAIRAYEDDGLHMNTPPELRRLRRRLYVSQSWEDGLVVLPKRTKLTLTANISFLSPSGPVTFADQRAVLLFVRMAHWFGREAAQVVLEATTSPRVRDKPISR